MFYNSMFGMARRPLFSQNSAPDYAKCNWVSALAIASGHLIEKKKIYKKHNKHKRN